MGWFVGFVLLIDWIVFETFPVWGPSRRPLIGATLKLIASVFFNVQPFSWLVDSDYGEQGLGVPWTNFIGIVFFHTGNCIDAIGMAPMFDMNGPFLSHGNLPVLGIFSYCLATWFLVIADGIAYFATPAPWGPNTHVSVNVSLICPGQIIGSTLLLIGSLFYTYWAAYPPAMAEEADVDRILHEVYEEAKAEAAERFLP